MYTKIKNRAQHVLQQVKRHRMPRAIKLAGDITDTVQLLHQSGLCGVHARNPTIAIYAACSTVIARAQDVRYTTSVGEEVYLETVCFMNVEGGMNSMNDNGTTCGENTNSHTTLQMAFSPQSLICMYSDIILMHLLTWCRTAASGPCQKHTPVPRREPISATEKVHLEPIL